MIVTFVFPSVSEAAQVGHMLLSMAIQHPQLQDIAATLVSEADAYENEAANII